MKFDAALMARLQAATQDLMKDGPLAATAAIRRALAGDTAQQPDGTPWSGATMKDANPPPSGTTMKDLNPPPEKAQARPRAWKAPHREQTTQSPPEQPSPQSGESPRSAQYSQPPQSGSSPQSGPSPQSMPDQPAATGAAPGIADMLAKAGIALPEGFAENFKEQFKGAFPQGFAQSFQEKFTGGLQGGLPENFAERFKEQFKGGLPEGFAESFKEKFNGGLPEGLLDGLPEALRNGKLPGARKRPPPPPLPDGARFDSASFTCHAGTRGYKLYVPSTYRDKCAGGPVPLVVMLHGCTQDPDDFAAGTRMNQVAEETGCLVVYPAQSQQANSSKCWNWFSAADQQRDRGEPAVIAGIARQVMAEYKVDPRRVAIAGLSAGGAMAVVVGTLYPELFRAVGVHSGLPFGSATDLPSALQAMQKGASPGARPAQSPPLIVFHGDKDRTVHPKNGGDVLQHGLVADGPGTAEVEHGKASGGRKFTRTVHRAADGRVLAEHWELHGAGHAWAGGSACGSYTDPAGPDASREMVRFFGEVGAGVPGA